jgi:hypothetical protein
LSLVYDEVIRLAATLLILWLLDLLTSPTQRLLAPLRTRLVTAVFEAHALAKDSLHHDNVIGVSGTGYIDHVINGLAVGTNSVGLAGNTGLITSVLKVTAGPWLAFADQLSISVSGAILKDLSVNAGALSTEGLGSALRTGLITGASKVTALTKGAFVNDKVVSLALTFSCLNLTDLFSVLTADVSAPLQPFLITRALEVFTLTKLVLVDHETVCLPRAFLIDHNISDLSVPADNAGPAPDARLVTLIFEGTALPELTLVNDETISVPGALSLVIAVGLLPTFADNLNSGLRPCLVT